MTKKLYNLMNWAAIEGIVYSEEDDPHEILGCHKVSSGILVQMFYPDAISAEVVAGKNHYKMEMADEVGFFAALLPKAADISNYYFVVETEKGIQKDFYDPYMFEPVISKADMDKFGHGTLFNAYEVLGAHVMKQNGINGVLFAVWAPNALRVSVVGDFNNWDGRIHQMRRLWDSGVFELFVPCAHENDNYKFEIKLKNGTTYLKADPYALSSQLRPETASIVSSVKEYKWNDKNWVDKRKKADVTQSAISVYSLHLGSFARNEDGSFLNYRELADKVVTYVKDMEYTHIGLMPVMEHLEDESFGYQVTGAFSPTSRYGSATDFKYFIDVMHKNDIGVILDCVLTDFPNVESGLPGFDGTCLYGHMDERKKYHPVFGTYFFNYGRPEVKSYLISSVLYWIKEFHADAIRIDELAAMLYLDYSKSEGDYDYNMYGGVENLDAIELIKQLNTAVKKLKNGVFTIADLSASWLKVTDSVEDDGLGFDMKWNCDFTNDFISYMQLDPIYRAHHHGELTNSMIYVYRENYMLNLLSEESRKGKFSMIRKMPGEIEDKFANLRAMYGFMMVHPGKKRFFMGQDIAQFTEGYSNNTIEWDLLENEQHSQVKQYIKDLNALYQNNNALYLLDQDENGFEWINNISANENVLVFLRKTTNVKETLLIVCNFANEQRSEYRVGVPYPGKYKECFNSDSKKYGGSNALNAKVISSSEIECDDRENSIVFKMAPLSLQVFSYTEFTAKEKAEIERRKEEERQRQIELSNINNAKEAETRARQMAEEAKSEALNAQLAAKEALKHAMAEAKKAEELEKQARELEREAMALYDQRIELKKNAKFVKDSDFPDEQKIEE